MSHGIPAPLLGRLSEFLSGQLGLRFPADRWNDLARGICSAARDFGFHSPEDAAEVDVAPGRMRGGVEGCIEWLTSSPLTRPQVEVLARHLTVGETYFLREKRSFEALEAHILPALIASRRGRDQRLRIWSAGCCTGEEPYSLAITLTRVLPDFRNWDLTILATDINAQFLERAAEGVFTEWSFRDVPAGFKEAFFLPADTARYQIKPHIRKLVKFDYLNLAEDVYPSLLNNTNGIDLILCRNVLIYLDAGHVLSVFRKLGRCLTTHGWLLVGAAEVCRGMSSDLVSVDLSGLMAYRKKDPCEAPEKSVRVEPVKNIAAPISDSGQAKARPIPEKPKVGPMPPQRHAPAQPVAGPSPLAEAVSLYEQGRYAEAAQLLQELAAPQRAVPGAAALLARTYANLGDVKSATRWCEAAIAADKLNPRLYYLHATILQECNDRAGAVVSLRRATYLDPDFVMAHFALGHLARVEGRSSDARRHLRHALELLAKYGADHVVPESDGITAARLKAIIAVFSEDQEALT